MGISASVFAWRATEGLYRDVLAHYGVTALPCKVRDPDRKGKVESGVNHAQMTPLKGKKFESLEEAQAYLDHWEERWADTRKLDLLHRFARLYQHPQLLDGDGDDCSIPELKAQSSKLREVVSLLCKIRLAEEKAIVFARHKDMQRLLARVFSNEFGKPIRIVNGDTPRATSLRKSGVETRSGILNQFRGTPGFDVLILSPFVAGVGLTIIEATHVIHYGRWWNPAVEAQATDRAYRLGQQKEVHVYLPIMEDKTGKVARTFDQLLDELMEGKKGIAKDALEKDDFLRPQESEDESGLRVFSGLQDSATSPTS